MSDTEMNERPSGSYLKNCFVPSCSNSSENTPEKWFVEVPTDKEMENKWLEAAGRARERGRTANVLYCCEDHFDAENDFKNYLYLQHSTPAKGVRVKLKRDVVPTKFECQPPRTPEGDPKGIITPVNVPCKLCRRNVKKKSLECSVCHCLYHRSCGMSKVFEWSDVFICCNTVNKKSLLVGKWKKRTKDDTESSTDYDSLNDELSDSLSDELGDSINNEPDDSSNNELGDSVNNKLGNSLNNGLSNSLNNKPNYQYIRTFEPCVRPSPPYTNYRRKVYQSMRLKNPKLTLTEARPAIDKMWAEIPREEKDRLFEEFEHKLMKYQQARKYNEYISSFKKTTYQKKVLDLLELGDSSESADIDRENHSALTKDGLVFPSRTDYKTSFSKLISVINNEPRIIEAKDYDDMRDTNIIDLVDVKKDFKMLDVHVCSTCNQVEHFMQDFVKHKELCERTPADQRLVPVNRGKSKILAFLLWKNAQTKSHNDVYKYYDQWTVMTVSMKNAWIAVAKAVFKNVAAFSYSRLVDTEEPSVGQIHTAEDGKFFI